MGINGARRKRPVLTIPPSPLELGLEFFALLVLIAIFLLLVVNLPGLPDRIPTHFDALGRPDAYGNKMSLLLLPCVSLGLYLLLTVTARFPQSFNYPWAITEENAERQYQMARTMLRGLKLELGLVMLYILWVQIQSAQNNVSGLNIAFLPIVLVMIFGTIGFYLWVAARAR